MIAIVAVLVGLCFGGLIVIAIETWWALGCSGAAISTPAAKSRCADPVGGPFGAVSRDSMGCIRCRMCGHRLSKHGGER